MSQATARALELELDFDLVDDDGEPLQTERHGRNENLVRELIEVAMEERGKSDFYVGADTFVYYTVAQARAIAKNPPSRENFKGPDVFFVDGVPGHERDYWVSWEEGWRLPDVVFELLSHSTEESDKDEKKDFYEQVFKTPEYFYFHPQKTDLEGYRLSSLGSPGGQVTATYRRIRPSPRGRLWSQRLDLYVGVWDGRWQNREGKWLRFFERDGRLIPTREERQALRAEAERERAEAERERAEAAEAEIARLKALLAQRQGSTD